MDTGSWYNKNNKVCLTEHEGNMSMCLAQRMQKEEEQ